MPSLGEGDPVLSVWGLGLPCPQPHCSLYQPRLPPGAPGSQALSILWDSLQHGVVPGFLDLTTSCSKMFSEGGTACSGGLS